MEVAAASESVADSQALAGDSRSERLRGGVFVNVAGLELCRDHALAPARAQRLDVGRREDAPFFKDFSVTEPQQMREDRTVRLRQR